MQVSRIKISNILGIEELEIEAGKFITVSGKNGVGKTSVVEAIKAALSGGHDATLLRNGADKGEVVLVLEDGATITKKVMAGKSEQSFADAEGRKIARPAEAIRQLVDALSVNPVEFLTVPRKQQVSALLEAMPMEADLAELSRISGLGLTDHYRGMHALDAIESVRKSIYDERTGVNRAAKEKAATVKQLSDSLPDDTVLPAGEDEEALRADLQDLETARVDALAKVDVKLEEIQSAHEAAVAEVREQIAALEVKITEANEGFRQAKLKAGEKKAEINGRAAVKRAELQGKLDVINAGREQRAKAAQARETVAVMTREASELEQQAGRLTDAIDRLDDYKASLLKSLPIPGLEVRGGDIFYHGIAFERLNSAEQVKVAVELAKIRAGKLGIVCVDGIERLDPDAFAAFREASIASGVQMVVTRVGDTPFTVESAA